MVEEMVEDKLEETSGGFDDGEDEVLIHLGLLILQRRRVTAAAGARARSWGRSTCLGTGAANGK